MTAARTRRLVFLVLGIASLAITLAWFGLGSDRSAIESDSRAAIERTREPVESEPPPPAVADPAINEAPAARERLVETRFECEVVGRVVDSDGAPLPRTRIEARHRLEQPDDLDVNGFVAPASVAIASADTDADGRFRLRELPCYGSIEIDLILDGYIGPSPSTQARLAYGPPIDAGTLELIRSASAIGIVVDDQGLPIGGANVVVLDAVVRHQTTSAGDGTFAFARLEPGVHVFFAQHGDFSPTGVDANVRTLEPGGRADDLRIVLEPLDTIDGVVLDEARSPVSSATVTADVVLSTEAGGRYVGRSVEICRVRSEADGTFAIRVPRDRNVGVTARSRGVPSERATSLARSPLELTIPRTPSIRVEVVDGATGIRVLPDNLLLFGRQHGNDGWWLMASFGAEDLASMRDASGVLNVSYGEIRLDDMLGWQALAEVRGYRPGASDLAAFPIEPGQTTRIEVGRGRVVTGVVTLEGSPVAGAEVDALEAGIDGPFAVGTTTDDSGRFRLQSITVRSFRLSARAPGLARVTIEVAADPSGADVAADLELKR